MSARRRIKTRACRIRARHSGLGDAQRRRKWNSGKLNPSYTILAAASQIATSPSLPAPAFLSRRGLGSNASPRFRASFWRLFWRPVLAPRFGASFWRLIFAPSCDAHLPVIDSVSA
jgi:hypothetical protein